jgi:TonB family protein
VAKVSAQTLSTLTMEQGSQRVKELDENISHIIAATSPLSPKDQFESTYDYNKRRQSWTDDQEQSVKLLRVALRKLQEDYYVERDLKAEFTSYDADQEELIAGVSGEKIVFEIPRADAKQMYGAWATSVVVARQIGVSKPEFTPVPTRTPVPERMHVGLVFNRKLYPEARLWNSSDDTVYKVGNGTTQPAVVFKVDPEYPEEARKAKVSGTVALSVIVGQDGKARSIHVVKSLGVGLDEKAIEAVKKWKFKPGMKGGQPVNVRATIEVNFRTF